MDNIVIDGHGRGSKTLFHPQLLSRLGFQCRSKERLAFDYFLDDFGCSIHKRQINKECILVNPVVSGLETNYNNLCWDVTCGHFMIHQTQEIQEGLCGLEDVNCAEFKSLHPGGTILIDAWFGSVGSWVSVEMRSLEARYTVVGDGDYEWEKQVLLTLHHNDKLIWTAPKPKNTNILNSFPLGMTIINMNCSISGADNDIVSIKNFDLSSKNIKIRSSRSYINNQFTGIAAIYFFGGIYGPLIHI